MNPRALLIASAVVVVVALSTPAAADSPPAQPAALVGATEVVKVAPAEGFVDDAIALDDKRLAYVLTDTVGKAELHVVTLDPRQDVAIDIATITTHPIALHFAGSHVLVLGLVEGQKQVAALVELAAPAGKKPGAVVYKLGPATNASLIVRDGKQVVALHNATPGKSGGVSHQVEIYALQTGKRIALGPALELDDKNENKTLELRVNHWADGMTRAIGLRGGEWDRKENMRTPDAEATWDLVTGKYAERKAITDLFEQRKRYQVLADAAGKLDFLHMVWDNSAVQVWRAGKGRTIELDQAIQQYEPKSLQGEVEADGSSWFALEVDPVNPDAVARKKADQRYLDVFHVGADTKATRKARVLAPAAHFRFGVGGKRFWVIERSPSFDRGGKVLAVYDVQ